MYSTNFADELFIQLAEYPIIDIHSHLIPGHLAAADLDKVLFYHMMRYPLRAAGVPPEQLWPGWEGERPFSRERPVTAYDGLDSHLKALATQGFGWMLRHILRDLYLFDEPITAESLPRLQTSFAEKTANPDWGLEVLTRAGIQRVYSSAWWKTMGEVDDIFRLTVEKSLGGGTREGWGWQRRLGKYSEKYNLEITSLSDLRETVGTFIDNLKWDGKTIYVEWVSSQADFMPVEDSVINSLISRCRNNEQLTIEESGVLEAALIRCTCSAVREHARIFQICYGTQYVTPGMHPHPIVRYSPHFASSLGRLIGDFPEIHFNILNSAENDEQTLCSLCQGYANISLGGFWYYAFYPSIMQRAWQRRLDMVPLNRLCGFFSDGYCVDWIYARTLMTRRVLANVLAERVAWGFCEEKEAVKIAETLLWETPERIFGS